MTTEATEVANLIFRNFKLAVVKNLFFFKQHIKQLLFVVETFFFLSLRKTTPTNQTQKTNLQRKTHQ